MQQLPFGIAEPIQPTLGELRAAQAPATPHLPEFFVIGCRHPACFQHDLKFLPTARTVIPETMLAQQRIHAQPG